jgi:oxalate decarboxylase/phosphoglucose isomerase-like protein (cupin superfamily)
MPAHHTLLELPKVRDSRGMLTFAQGANLPFAVRRLFMLYDLTPGTARGGHAHRGQHQLVFLMHGSAQVVIDNGKGRESVTLDRPSMALYAPPMLWLELSEFTPCATCAVLSSGDYDESDYVRDYAEFLKLAG